MSSGTGEIEVSWVPVDYQERSLWRTRIAEAKITANIAPPLREKASEPTFLTSEAASPIQKEPEVATPTASLTNAPEIVVKATRRVWNTLRQKRGRAVDLEAATETPTDIAVTECFSVSFYLCIYTNSTEFQ